jgi:uncharacterized protein DUF5994
MALLTDHDSAMSAVPPTAEPRLRLGATRSGRRILDGRWWPRSTDPAAEFPGLVRALDVGESPSVRLLLSAAGWSRRPHHIEVNGRTVTLGYFSDQPTSILTASQSDGGSRDLLVIWTEPDQEN